MSPRDPARRPRESLAAPAPGTHAESEHFAWTIQIPDHHDRKDSPEYIASRAKMHELVDSVDDFTYGGEPFEDHHGGGLWVKDQDGWFMVRNLAGIEWSAQFCADPEKVDILRRNARRLYAAFPEAVDALGIRELLDTEITDADGVERWTDSICNASVPLPVARHRGTLPKSKTGGVHHYPSPITEIELFKRDDFDLWVRDGKGDLAAVVPVGKPGSGDGRTRVLFAARRVRKGQPTPLGRIAAQAPHELGAVSPELDAAKQQQIEDDAVLPADHPLSLRAYARQ
jgi:hypothetical protein